jgi:hypothetical protein
VSAGAAFSQQANEIVNESTKTAAPMCIAKIAVAFWSNRVI